MKDKLTYSNVMATIAVFLSLGAGAYAVGIGRNDVKSRHIADNTIRSKDVRDKGLYGRDIHEESLGFKEIREDRLDVNQFAKVASVPGGCDPSSAAYVACGSLTVQAEQVIQLLVVAAGAQTSGGAAPASGFCQVVIDGALLDGSQVRPGDTSIPDGSNFAENGFTTTQVSQRLAKGPHIVALQCNELEGDTRLNTDLSVLLLDAI